MQIHSVTPNDSD